MQMKGNIGLKNTTSHALRRKAFKIQDVSACVNLMPIHREAMNVDKRLLIRGEGLLGETKIDQRANAPTFRIRRSCVIQDIDLDMTGFRECISVEGPAHTRALFTGCKLK